MSKKVLLTALLLIAAMCPAVAEDPFVIVSSDPAKVISLSHLSEQNLINFAVRDDQDRVVVDGTPGYWNNNGDKGQGNLTRSREAVFDGRDDTFFDPNTYYNTNGNCWAGIELTNKFFITKIRYKGRSDGANYTQLRQMTGCIFQGANQADFSDAVDLAVADVERDRTSTATWNGTNYWCEIDLTNFTCDQNRAFSEVLKNRKAYKYLRIIGPTPYKNDNNNQNGMCCGNVSELEFYGRSESVAPTPEEMSGEEYRPVISGAHVGEDNVFVFDAEFPIVDDGLFTTYGYEVFRQLPTENNQLRAELIEAGLEMPNPGETSFTHRFTDPGAIPGARYWVRGFNHATETPFADVETPMFYQVPGDIAVTASDADTVASRITWTNTDTNTYMLGTVVMRATSPGGPWTRLNTDLIPLDVMSYEDSDVIVGIPYYYQLSYVMRNFITGDTYEGPASEAVMFRASESIERVWNAEHTSSVLKEGMKAICQFKPWNAEDSAYQNLNNEFGSYDGDPFHLFDGDVNTYSDIQPKDGNLARGTARDDGSCKAGVDLGRRFVITKARIHPRVTNNSTEKARFAKLGLFASNSDSVGEDDGWRNDENCVQLTPRFQNPNPYASYYEVSVTDPTPYRYVFIKHANMTADELGKQEAFANAAELELFGYEYNEDLENLLTAPDAVSYDIFDSADNDYGSKGIKLSWSGDRNATSYEVQWRQSDSDQWQTIATGLTDATYFRDCDELQDLGMFRIGAMREIEEQPGAFERAYSRTQNVYAMGNGTGLYVYYKNPYRDHVQTMRTWERECEPNIDYHWGADPIIPEHPDAANGIGIIWNGKLIVPVTGTYEFSCTCSGGFALRISDEQVINDWSSVSGDSAYSGKIYLTAGEHEFRADFQTFEKEGTPNEFCTLYWGGSVAYGVIPASQFIPVKRNPLAYPWIGDHTFEAKVKGYTKYIPTTNIVMEAGADGVVRPTEKIIDGFELIGAGDDFWLQETACHMAGRMVTGDFLISAKFERQIYNKTPSMANDSLWAWKGMLVARKDLGLQTPVVAACFASNGNAGRADLKVRNEKGGDIFDHGDRVWNLAPVVYQKLERKGNVFTQAFSDDGENWEVVKEYVDEQNLMRGRLYVGPAVSSIINLKELGKYRVTMVKVVSDPGSGIVFVR